MITGFGIGLGGVIMGGGVTILIGGLGIGLTDVLGITILKGVGIW
jgi:hypothetical protein